jgi:hypothetical protein
VFLSKPVVLLEVITKTSNDNIKPEQILTETLTGTDANNIQNPGLVLRGTSSMTDTSGIRYQGLVLKGTLAKTDINDIRNQGLVLREISSKTDTNISFSIKEVFIVQETWHSSNTLPTMDHSHDFRNIIT